MSDDSFVARTLKIHRVLMEGGYRLVHDFPIIAEFSAQLSDVDPAGVIYPDLVVDTSLALATPAMVDPRLRAVGDGFIPVVGGFLSFDGPKPLYTYATAHPDTSSLEGLTVALSYQGTDARYVLFNFPLSVMERGGAYEALNVALLDLSGDISGADKSARSAIESILESIYTNSGADPNRSFDLNSDGVVDLRDAVEAINRTSH